MNRRNFLKLGSSAMLSSGLATSPTFGLGKKSQAGDYKALVCIFLLGGNDAFNMVVPTSTFEYDEYLASRQNLAIDKNTLLPISPLTYGGARYGMHDQCSELSQLFEQGKLAIMANVGNLIQPTTREQILNSNAMLPRQLFSHNDQQDQWRYGDPLTKSSGWGGRASDFYVSNNTESLLTSVAIDGRSNWLASNNNLDLSISHNGFDSYKQVLPDRSHQAERRTAFRALLGQNYANPILREFSETQERTMEVSERVGTMVQSVPDFMTDIPNADNLLSSRLQMVARLIAARESLGMTRQVFYVGMSGFDTHSSHMHDQPALLQKLSEAMNYFYELTVELGVAEKVTTFTSSEFGRTLTSNGDGTDHGWGNHQFIMGDSVKGKDIYGVMPSLEIGGPDDSDNDGRIIPTTSIEQYVEPLLNWYGLDSGQVNTVLPNLSAFSGSSMDFML